MKTKLVAALLASLTLAVVAAPAFAHSAMTQSSIADNATLSASPPEFTATFEHETSVAAVKLVSSTGQQVQLNYKPTPAMSKTLTVALPKLAAGSYTLTWRAVAKDGHTMPGSIHFTITGK